MSLGLNNELEEAEKYLNDINDNFLDIHNKKNKDKPIQSKPFQQSNDNNNNPTDLILSDYKKRLRSFGYPDIGNITLSKNDNDKEKTLNFFEYLIQKKANESHDYQTNRIQSETIVKRCEQLEATNTKLEKEISKLNDELKTITKNKKNYEGKLTNLKESYEKQLNTFKSNNTLLTNKLSKITLDKKGCEEKLSRLSDAYSKITNKITTVKPSNSIDITEYIKQNELGKMLSKVKGAEKLVEMLKTGYNESLRELLFEISSLKNFIYELHTEIKSIIERPLDFNSDLINLPFLDTVSNIKMVFMQNIQLIRSNEKFRNDNYGSSVIADNQPSISETHVNNFLQSLDIPINNSANKKSYQEEEEEDIIQFTSANHKPVIHSTSHSKGNLNHNTKEKDLFDSFARSLNQLDSSQNKASNNNSIYNTNSNNKGTENKDMFNYDPELEMKKNHWTKTFLSMKDDNDKE